MVTDLNAELMQQLVAVFRVQLEEQIQLITEGLLQLEKGATGEQRKHTMEGVFRAAHNIKGAARGVGIQDIAEISHHLESVFSEIKRQESEPPAELIDVCLASLDKLREAMTAFGENRPVNFDMRALLSQLDALCTENNTPVNTATPAATGIAAQHPEPATETAAPVATSEPRQPAADPVAPAQTKPAAAETMRINLEKLEKVAALVDELQGARIEMEDHLANFQQLRAQLQMLAGIGKQAQSRAKDPAADNASLKAWENAITALNAMTARMHRDMRTSIKRLGLNSASLQNDMRMMQLVPVATLLRPMERMVRDLARELDKQVEFRIVGEDIEMDRAVLDDLKDPMVHLLRNALDHGIEPSGERQANGKDATGRLAVSVQGQGSQIVFSIEDDGAGIDADRVADIALQKKLVSAAELEAMEPGEKLDLIFRPGFSTREIITNLSGRGVGLDVVAANLRKLRGSVQVQSEPGKGTTFRLRLPLTLATDHGLLVRASGDVCAIPTSSVDRIIDISPEEIVEVEASQAILLNGRAIPLRDLATVLEMPNQRTLIQDKLHIVVLSKGWNAVAFLVDEVLGEREMVIKPLKPPLVSVRNVTGGTLTGNGEVIMVLDPASLVDSALRARSDWLKAKQTPEEIKVSRILVVDDSITTRTLEKNILENMGYAVTVAVDGKKGWEALQQQAFDLVVTDVEMPLMDGFELTEKIKQSEQFMHIPVVVVTSLAKDTDRRRGIEAGADAYIVKGQFETKALLDVIEQLI